LIAVDTNVLVRLVVQDDPSQAKRSVRLLSSEDVYVPKTVLLEMEWVLRYAYEIERSRILTALRGIVGLPNVSTEDPVSIARALDWFERGLDFADALHLVSSGEADRFLTFDEKLLKRAARLTELRVGRP
jgi:predicted nucleic-acid-binding protein